MKGRSASIALVASIALTACSDSLVAPQDSELPPNVTALNCAGSVQGISCTPSGANAYVTYGNFGNSTNTGPTGLVNIAGKASTVTFSSGVLSEQVDVHNLLSQPLATTDWTTADAAGVKVFFHTAPTNGVTITNADGTGTFTAANQSYFQYNEIIAANGVNQAPKTWSFNLPTSGTTFTFQVYVQTALPNESGGAAANIPAHTFTAIGRSSGTFGSHHCAIRTGGSIYCWGFGASGEFGVGPILPFVNGGAYATPYSQPVQALSPLTYVAIGSGDGHTCAVTSAALLRCWGVNPRGQLGDGSTTQRTLPTAVSGISGVTSVAGGSTHTCAVASGAAYCWGRSNEGQLGDGTSSSGASVNKTSPQVVPGLTSGVTVISAGAGFTCAVVNGGAKCWGDRNSGEIGDGGSTSGSQTTPIDVFLLTTGVTDVSASDSFACAVVSGGVKCWGTNAQGQLGNAGANSTAQTTPITSGGLAAGSNVTKVVAGRFHTCALISGGTVKCWGFNGNGQLGASGGGNTAVTAGITSVADIAISKDTTCALKTDGTIWCWGANGDGMLGNGTPFDSGVHQTPVKVILP